MPRVRRGVSLVVLAGYAAVSFAYFGWWMVPHPGRIVPTGQDPDIYVWGFGWWAHALGHLTNPFVSHALYAPIGVNMMWTPSAPGLAFLFTPLTALVGPVASYNVASVLAPALSAWTAYLLCRYLTGSVWASVVGGYLFGFSDAVIRQAQPGNINLSSVFLLPLIALVVLRYLRRELDGRGLAWRLGLLLALQLTISTEFLVMATIALAVSLLLAYLLVFGLRPRLRHAPGPIAAGYGLGALFAAPFTYYLLVDFESGGVVANIKDWGTDVLGPIVPNRMIAVGGGDLTSLAAQIPSRSVYLGLPTVLIILLYGAREWRSPRARFLLAALGAAGVATLGATLRIGGHTLFTLPWWTAATHVPGLADALPFRFGILVSLAASVIVAIWAGTGKGLVFPRPYVLPVLAVVAIVPPIWDSGVFSPRHPTGPRFFTAGIYKSCLSPGETLVVFLQDGDLQIWQAEDGFRFDLASGALQPFVKHGKPLNAFDEDPVVGDLSFVTWANPTIGRLLAFAAVHGVDRVVALAGTDYPSDDQMRAFGRPQRIGGVTVAPACHLPSLRTHNLAPEVAGWEKDPKPDAADPTIAYCEGGTFVTLPSGLVPLPSSRASHANFIQGKGLTCASPPSSFRRRGFAPSTLGVTGGVYPYYAP
jgi:dolichyl-phosphate beta-glucosyltransferase